MLSESYCLHSIRLINNYLQVSTAHPINGNKGRCLLYVCNHGIFNKAHTNSGYKATNYSRLQHNELQNIHKVADVA
jgi:hypothetical protein